MYIFSAYGVHCKAEDGGTLSYRQMRRRTRPANSLVAIYFPVYAISSLLHIAGRCLVSRRRSDFRDDTSEELQGSEKSAGPSPTATLIGGTSSPLYEGAFQLQNRGVYD
jgi:hypothetical protein